MKIKFWDKNVIASFLKVFGVISTLISVLLIFIDISSIFEMFSIPDNKGFIIRLSLLAFFLVFMIILYFFAWLYCNSKKKVSLKITNTAIEIKYGDIFTETDSLKVIGFNEYFDTIVDDKIISSNSLHGMLINKYYETDEKLEALNNSIDNEIIVLKNKKEPIIENVTKSLGKVKKIPLGKIIKVDDFLLLSLTHFDDNNEAHLKINDYINCLFCFWKEISRLYNGSNVAIPLLGSNLTRIRGYEDISDQELLELMILTFKLSKLCISSPAKIKIILFKKDEDTINLLKLKDYEK